MIPKYEAIAADIRRSIEDGALKPGDKLPTVVEFCKLYSVSKITVKRAIEQITEEDGLKYKERGLLSSKTTTIKSRDESKTVTASTLSGDAVQITAGGNTNMTGSQVIGTHDVAISSGKDTSISSAEEYEQHDYAKQVKKSGLLSGGGLGFTIGMEKRKDQYKDADMIQKGSTAGSISGNVTITSDKDIHNANNASQKEGD